MKKSKMPIVGGILIGLGVLSFGGIAKAESKATLIIGALVFIAVGGLLLYLGIKKNKEITTLSAEEKSKAKPSVKAVTQNVERDFYSKVVGVTFGNDDGTSRQEYIKKLKPGQELIFKPVPTPEYPDAIGVFTLKGKQIGHVKADLATELKERYPDNYMNVTVSEVTGGGGKTYGCNIHIIIYA